jgi:hypothetical protein
MDTRKIVVHVVQREGCDVVVQLLGESVGQPGEAAIAHADGEVLAFRKGVFT